MATKKKVVKKTKKVTKKAAKKKVAPKKRVNPICSSAGRSLVKKRTHKAGRTLGSRTCCKKKGSGKKCVNKGKKK